MKLKRFVIALSAVFILTFSTSCLEQSGIRVTSYFSSQQECKPAVISFLNSAESEIEIAIYGLTEEDIVNELIKIHKEGIIVRVIADKLQSKGRYSRVKELQGAEVPLKIMRGFSGGIMHHKFMVVDAKRVLTGSYNFTTGATKRNYENFVIIESKEIAEKYAEEFKRMWKK